MFARKLTVIALLTLATTGGVWAAFHQTHATAPQSASDQVKGEVTTASANAPTLTTKPVLPEPSAQPAIASTVAPSPKSLAPTSFATSEAVTPAPQGGAATTLTSDQVAQLIQQTLDSYVAQGKFKGDPGPIGPQGPPGATASGAVSVIAPQDPKLGGTTGSFKYLSADSATAKDLTVTGTCTGCAGGGMSLGGVVAGGTANSVLFLDAAGKLAQDDNLTFTSSNGLQIGPSYTNAGFDPNVDVWAWDETFPTVANFRTFFTSNDAPALTATVQAETQALAGSFNAFVKNTADDGVLSMAVDAGGFAIPAAGTTITRVTGLHAYSVVFPDNGGTVANANAAFLEDGDHVGGKLTNDTALEISDVSGGTNNYAIKTGLGKVSFGDSVGIATTTPGGTYGEKLTVVGGTYLNGNATTTGNLALNSRSPFIQFAPTTAGDKLSIQSGTTTLASLDLGGTFKTKGPQSANASPDYAETIAAASDVGPADVVVADPLVSERVIKSDSGYQKSILGVVSSAPGFLIRSLNRDDLSEPTIGVPLALTGRVPVKVSSENGPIAIGDPLTSSDNLPGFAMKATKAGEIVGYSLSSFDGTTSQDSTSTPTVTVFLKPGFWQGPVDGDGSIFAGILNQLANLGIQIEQGVVTVKEFIADKITAGQVTAGEVDTDKLCVNGLCVTHDQLQQLLNTAGTTPPRSDNASTTTP